MTFFYDDLTDVMHISIEAKSGPCMHVESPSGAILLVERETERLIGLTIPYFMARLRDGSLSLPEIGTTSLPRDFLHKLRIPPRLMEH
jgi:hypothetical protein